MIAAGASVIVHKMSEDDDGDDENLEEGLSGALCPIQGLPLARSSHTAMQST